MECCNCGAPAAHQHHIVPRAVGGTDRPSNLAPVCERCHGLIHERAFVRHQQLTKAGLAAAKARGVQLGGARPGAAEAASRARTSKAKAAAERLRPVLEPLVASGASLRAIAAALAAAGTSGPDGAPLPPTSVKRLIQRLELA